MDLRARAGRAFEDALVHTVPFDELEPLTAALREAHEHLDEPMRVAIVGHIKAGKSTMLNALLGEEAAPMGKEELTFNVSWLRFGKEPGLRVVFKNGRAPEERGLEELYDLTARADERAELLRSVRYLEIRKPIQILKTFDLVDTPGLRSFYEQDSLNTMRSLGLADDHIDDETRRESALADALLCLFSRSIAAADQAVVADFQGPLLGQATPVNAIGVLTKVDTYWDPAEPERDPLDEGRRVARIIESEPGADRVFFAVLPVCGLLGLGAQTLTAEHGGWIESLARLDPALLAKRLRYADRFASASYEDLPLPPPSRSTLLGLLGQFGIWSAARIVREGAGDVETLRERLLELSGIERLRETLVAHFGRRALLIKAQTGTRKARTQAQDVRRRVDADAAGAAFDAMGSLEALETGEPALEEFALLRRYYQDSASLGLEDGEAAHLLEVTGERGPELGPRLGLTVAATPSELVAAAEARCAYWHARGDEFGVDPRTKATAAKIERAYRRLLYHAREARRHLELVE
ncbi:MAG TPA: dynamin family protein [Solirubrobacteraceae bacterium]|jgi:hypothetical protein